MEETPLEATPQFEAPAPKRKINKRFLYLAGFVVLIILLFLGYKLFGSSKTVQNATPTPTPTPAVFELPTDTPTPAESPTETPTNTPIPSPTVNPVDKATGLDRSKLSVTIENGSGEAGVAKKGADYLTGLGYSVSGTSNADNFDYTNVTIQVKSSSSDYLNLLKKDLGFNYTVGSATSDLANSADTDAVVIIGK